MRVLTINVGSSSIRFELFSMPGEVCLQRHHQKDLQATSKVDLLKQWMQPEFIPSVIIHRVVHGGSRFTAPCVIDAEVEAEIERLSPLAPLHHPRILALIAETKKVFKNALQIAVFDTAFYHELPRLATSYALPGPLCQSLKIKRFGFHGLAHQGMLERWDPIFPINKSQAKVISIQLGSGCSITASSLGKPVDTSMGFTPLEGLMMATRSGDIDPGILLYLQQEKHFSAKDIEELLTKQSGLLGVSGISSDMKELLSSKDPQAMFAVDLYCYRVQKYIGAYLAVLGGADAILLGGGVLEHSALIRHKILTPFRYAGILLDETLNESISPGHYAPIHTSKSHAELVVIPTEESSVLLRQASPLYIQC